MQCVRRYGATLATVTTTQQKGVTMPTDTQPRRHWHEAMDPAAIAVELPETDPVRLWMADPVDPLPDEVEVWLAERAALVLPDHDIATAVRYVAALHRHAVHGTESTFAALLAAQPFADRVDADDALHAGTIHQEPAPYGWLEPATATSAVPAKALHKRADGTVRGHDNVHVVGRDGDGIVRTMPAGELLTRATLWAASQGATLPDLIGTDSYSWAEVITYKPESACTVDGIPYVARPDGAGDSIVGNGRKRRGHRARVAQYHPRPTLEYLPWLHFLATGERVRKTYRTRFLVTVDHEQGADVRTYAPRVVRLGRVATGSDPRYVNAYAVRDSLVARRAGAVVRTGTVRAEWEGFTRQRTAVTICRAARSTGRRVESAIVVAVDALPDRLAAAFADRTMPSRYRVTRADGTRVTVTVNHDRRRYEMNVKHADGTATRRQARTLVAAVRTAATL